jgi:hypothetical protein
LKSRLRLREGNIMQINRHETIQVPRARFQVSSRESLDA